MLVGPLALNALLSLALFASSAVAKPQSQVIIETETSLFERYVSSHLRRYSHLQSSTAAATYASYTSRLSKLLHNAHAFVVAGTVSTQNRSGRLAHRTATLASSSDPRAPISSAKPVVEAVKLSFREVTRGKTVGRKSGKSHLSKARKVGRSHLSKAVRRLEREVGHVVEKKRTFDDDPEEGGEVAQRQTRSFNDDPEEDWSWIDDGDEEDTAEDAPEVGELQGERNGDAQSVFTEENDKFAASPARMERNLRLGSRL